jgi:hypothetical protein
MAIETTTKYICDNCNEEIEISYGMLGVSSYDYLYKYRRIQ